MKFGLFDHLDQTSSALSEQYENRLKFAEYCDAEGFYAYHIAEHHVTPLGLAPSPLLYLSAMAQRTRTLRFGPLVLPLPLYHPLRLYEEICMLDQLSGGRLELGIGKGISPHEISAFGQDAARAQDHFNECLAFLDNAFTEPVLNFEGEFFSFSNIPLPLKAVQAPRPPMWYGVLKPSSAAWAAERGMNVVCGAGPAEEARAAIDAYQGAYTGRGEPMAGLLRQIVIAPDQETARRRAAPAFSVFRENFTFLWDHFNDPLAKQLLPEDMDSIIQHGEAIVGSPSQVLEKLGEELEFTGANYLVCRFAFGNLSIEHILESLSLFCEEVKPDLEKLASVTPAVANS
tara:strand:+ start:8952 stop:9983 length:1032 start_codon:yes stop_codon:yes gene_type:complete